MKKYITMHRSINRSTGRLVTYVGQEIIAPSLEEAQEIVNKNFPYLYIYAEKVCEWDYDTLKVIDVQLN